MNTLTESEQKLQAAYALNLCAVSVSQIVEYQDVNIMEQEYEAILNNLNLENMPKDEALLEVLRQILDVITFFRIQDGDRKLLEKKYEQKMKNALWRAMPNPGIFLTGGSLASIGVSLAYAVGTGYMNYRNVKAEASMEQEEEQWKLQRSAIEQLNGLRRELFTTAWRLATNYEFPDSYRLTENQIRQYNSILMDTDVIRKYERLYAIKDKFEAYPNFWYELGHAANAIVWEETLNFSDEMRVPYRKQAKQCFDRYFTANKFLLLREDQTVAACALEYADLLDVVTEKALIEELLEKAQNACGQKADVLQLCAFKYLQIGEKERTAALLRYLVNEGYNEVVNGQILSAIYADRFYDSADIQAKADHALLSQRVNPAYLCPIDCEDFPSSMQLFIDRQKSNLAYKLGVMIDELKQKYELRFNRVIPVPKYDSREESYFSSSPEAVAQRIEDGERELKRSGQRFKDLIFDAEITTQYSHILSEMLKATAAMPFIQDEEKLNPLVEELNRSIKSHAKEISALVSLAASDNVEYASLMKPSFSDLTDGFFSKLVEVKNYFVDSREDMHDFTLAESSLTEFCIREELTEPALEDEQMGSQTDFRFAAPAVDLVQGINQEELSKSVKRSLKVRQLISDNISDVLKETTSIKVYYKNTSDFDAYIAGTKNKTLKQKKPKILAILDDCSEYDYDLAFTDEGIVPIKNGRGKTEISYTLVERTPDGIKIGSMIYDHHEVNLDSLMDMITGLKDGAMAVKKTDPMDVVATGIAVAVLPAALPIMGIANLVKQASNGGNKDLSEKMAVVIRANDKALRCKEAFAHYIIPDFSPENLDLINSNFLCGEPVDDIIAFYDSTNMKNYKCGILFTISGMYYKNNNFSSLDYFAYKDITKVEIEEAKGKTNAHRLIIYRGEVKYCVDDVFDSKALSKILNEMVNLSAK